MKNVNNQKLATKKGGDTVPKNGKVKLQLKIDKDIYKRFRIFSLEKERYPAEVLEEALERYLAKEYVDHDEME